LRRRPAPTLNNGAGYLGRPYSIIQCGYSSLEGCENAVGNGKGAMCFVNPDVTLNSQRATPVFATKRLGLTSRPDPLAHLIRTCCNAACQYKINNQSSINSLNRMTIL
jgi:hypothetical protein